MGGRVSVAISSLTFLVGLTEHGKVWKLKNVDGSGVAALGRKAEAEAGLYL